MIFYGLFKPTARAGFHCQSVAYGIGVLAAQNPCTKLGHQTMNFLFMLKSGSHRKHLFDILFYPAGGAQRRRR
jgi:hypothetical protein